MPKIQYEYMSVYIDNQAIFIISSIHYKYINIVIFTLTSANLTGHVERVGIENFELLKVLGTGGKCSVTFP